MQVTFLFYFLDGVRSNRQYSCCIVGRRQPPLISFFAVTTLRTCTLTRSLFTNNKCEGVAGLLILLLLLLLRVPLTIA